MRGIRKKIETGDSLRTDNVYEFEFEGGVTMSIHAMWETYDVDIKIQNMTMQEVWLLATHLCSDLKDGIPTFPSDSLKLTLPDKRAYRAHLRDGRVSSIEVSSDPDNCPNSFIFGVSEKNYAYLGQWGGC